ncbi:hypothetical protein [Hyalangium rubrum]|uniref:Uncharacterized protein n=1 Tax=Hyalangium rubrum TaxID=3103134 RepID=A0ABU5HHY1_9BACT|nr:hypothetical protein [Hyalangium sp. s54d21]MDY7233072.1 hypothetical protein [Hyalangium sp. s54d21]
METGFTDRLVPTLKLTLAGTEHTIPSGNVRTFELDLCGWGLEGWVEFLVVDDQGRGGKQKDEILADFLEADLGEVSLELKASFTDSPTMPEVTSLQVKGLIIDKSLTEMPATMAKGAPLLHRRYSVHFCDAARLLWRQHHPTVLYTSKTLKDVFDAHKGDKISLTYDWTDGLETSCPMIFLGLDPDSGASFYDFMLWYVDTRNGVLSYDYTEQGYKLSAAKDASGTPLDLRPEDVAEVEVVFPEVIRHDVTVLNSYTESTATEAITQEQAVSGIRQDILLRTPIADEVQARVTLETARLKIRGLEVELKWRRLPAASFTPGMLVKLPGTTGFSAAGVPASETFRVRRMHLRGEAIEAGADSEHQGTTAGYHFSMSSRLERKDETYVELPEYRAPRYPRYIEGKIVSEVGEDTHETWQAYTDSETSVDSYKVKIPLWENQIITVPFNANLQPGQFYFPAYKGSRVLVAMDFQQAWLKRFLDWRAGARMPSDGQGVQLLMGKTTTSGTAMKHYYEDAKPVFQLQRINDKDTAKIEVKEGSLLILVQEEQS